MKIAINQPYFLPYLGYFQLIAAADLFVAYENVAYTKRSWISRNRLQGKAKEPYFISLPTVKTANGTLIRDVYLHETAKATIKKLLKRIRNDYARAPHFSQVIGEIESMLLLAPRTRLVAFNNHCLKHICELLSIKTKLSLSHDDFLDFENEITSAREAESPGIKSKRIFGLMSRFDANHYLNLSGGKGLYGQAEFGKQGFDLDFLKIPSVEYIQFENSFAPHLSILDVLFHCGVEQTQGMVFNYALHQKERGKILSTTELSLYH